jgi:LmbE family N-acetylglucosaminyl deacetylase
VLTGTGPVLVVAPHPDDEVLGAGGTIARLASEGRDVHVAIVTKGGPPLFEEAFIERGREEARAAHGVLGVKETVFLEGFPAALLDTIPQSTLNAGVREAVDAVEPELLFIPFPGDLHIDHRKVAEAALVAARPNRRHGIEAVLAYEALSETNWSAPGTEGFAPNVFVDISEHLETKLEAMGRFESQLQPFPHERSLEALRALAVGRGATAGLRAAEAFVLIRSVVEAR